MNSRLSVLSLALLSMVSALAPGRVVAASSEPSAVRVRVVMVDARLRSAFIQRATGFDRSPPPATFAARQRELRDHFDAVLSLLVANTPRSLETALDRLEQRRGEDWSNDERVMWRQRLAEERLTNVRRLHRYQRRGLFPINQHVADRAAPVFVDNYDTACAVGHLMRESGWSEEVAAIQAENNLVYVTDVAEGPVVEWVATSGLTQEEAAIIQPAYGITPPAEAGITFGAGGGVEVRGVRYDHFEVYDPSEGSVAVPDLVIAKAAEVVFSRPPGPGGFVNVSPGENSLGAGIRYGTAWAGDTPNAPLYDRWLMVTPNLGQTQPGQYSLTGYEFEVAAQNPRERIDSITLVSDYVIGHWAFPYYRGGHGFAGFEVWSESNELLGSGSIEDAAFTYLLDGRQVASFAPQQRVKVRVGVFAWDGFAVTGLGHEVNLISVPEASSLAMSVIMLCLVAPLCRACASRGKKQQERPAI
jgi:hypothetical protein